MVKIPPGVSKGSTLRVRGEGDAGPKGYMDIILSFAGFCLFY
jgi:DnaJ-class molecular chaperone